MIKETRGFTVVELLIAMSLTGLAIGFSYQSYQFFQQQFVRWQARIALEAATGRLMTSMLNDLGMMRTLIRKEDESLAFVNQDRKVVTYRLNQRQVYKDERALLTTGLFAGKLQFRYFYSSGEEAIFLDQLNDIERVEIELIIQNSKQMIFEITSGVALRNKRVF